MATRILHFLLYFMPPRLFFWDFMGGSLLSYQWCHYTAVLPELLLKWQDLILVQEVQRKTRLPDISVIRQLLYEKQPFMFVQIENIIDSILVMQVFDQHSSGLWNVISVFFTILERSFGWLFSHRAHWRHLVANRSKNSKSWLLRVGTETCTFRATLMSSYKFAQRGPPGGGQCSLCIQHFPESNWQRWLHPDPRGDQWGWREDGIRLGQSCGEH